MSKEQNIKMLSETLAAVLSKQDVSFLLNGGVKSPSKKDRKERIRLRFTREAIKEEYKKC